MNIRVVEGTQRELEHITGTLTESKGVGTSHHTLVTLGCILNARERATIMAWRVPFPPSRIPASVEFSIKLVVCLKYFEVMQSNVK